MHTNNIYVQLGQNIVSQNDPLRKISLEQLFSMISKPEPLLVSKINQLRTVLTIDPKRYQALKKMLPYITCGIFNPPYRRSDNFAAISAFIVDMDHLSSKQIQPDELKSRLKQNENLYMLFTSPGNDGLKLLFLLKEKCYDKAVYSMFYKLFVSRFSVRYNLQQVVDTVTSDVTRACFLSADEKAWVNPGAIPVDINQYMDLKSDTGYDLAQKEIREFEKTQKDLNIQPSFNENSELPGEILQFIREKLNPNIRVKKEKHMIVPEELGNAERVVRERVTELGITLVGADPINYGKKFIFQVGMRKAQLNLFYGKRGFVIVKQPVNGADAELTDIVHRILCELFIPQ